MNLKENLKLNFKSRHAGLAAVTNITVLIGLIILNLLVQKIPAQLDMTRKKLFSLTEQTVTLIDSIEQETVIYLLSKPGQETKDVMEVLERYDSASPAIRVETLDPDRNPGLISRYSEEGQTVSPGSVLVVSGDNARVINRFDLYNISYDQQGRPQILGMTVEQRITAALAYVTTGREPKVYELEGHNEYKLAELNLADPLTKANYVSESLNLMRMGSVPADADVVVILSPERDLSPRESEALGDYLAAGGALFISLDLAEDTMPELNSLLASWNLEMQRGVVMEKDTNRLLPGMGNNPVFFSPRLPDENAITDNLKENSLDAFVFAAMGMTETAIRKRNLDVTPLLTSSANSWLRTDLNDGSENRIASDIQGPVTVAASVTETNRDTGMPEGARLVVMGSGKSLSVLPGLGQIKANIEFFLNSLNWLSDQGESVNIPSKSLFRLPLQMNALQAWIYAGIVIILLPLLIILAATVIVLRRKHL